MIFVITMAGASSRFINAGYPPKYTLEIKPGYTMFEWSLDSFEEYFTKEPELHSFIFVTSSADATLFVKSKLSKEKYKNMRYRITTLDDVTRGQAESAYIPLRDWKYSMKQSGGIDTRLRTEELVIFNIDTARHNFYADMNKLKHGRSLTSASDGLIDVLEDKDAEEKKWSFCRTDGGTRVLETAEKLKIGDYCSTGIYYFNPCSMYIELYETILASHVPFNFYIAPMYNLLIGGGGIVSILKCEPENVEFAGVPEDYEKIKKKYSEEKN